MQNQNRPFQPILHSTFIILHSEKGVTDGTRTRDVQDHNLALYQLSYGHQLTRRRHANAFDGANILPETSPNCNPPTDVALPRPISAANNAS